MKYLLLLTLIVINSHTFKFKLVSNTPTCLKMPGNGSYVIQYVVSGANDQNVEMEVYDGDQFVTRQEGKNQFKSTIKFFNEKVKICFKRQDGTEKAVSFDYFYETDPVRAIIDKKEVATTMVSLESALSSLKEVGRNQKYHIERNEINRTILQQSEIKIKWTGIIKIMFLITSALIQLWIMKSFFNRNSVPYQPVDQM